jgi:hypothetical protein
MGLEESLKVADTVKWPAAAIIFALVVYFTLRPQIKALIEGLRKRGFKALTSDGPHPERATEDIRSAGWLGRPCCPIW